MNEERSRQRRKLRLKRKRRPKMKQEYPGFCVQKRHIHTHQAETS